MATCAWAETQRLFSLGDLEYWLFFSEMCRRTQIHVYHGMAISLRLFISFLPLLLSGSRFLTAFFETQSDSRSESIE